MSTMPGTGRSGWGKIPHPGPRRRAEQLYKQLDMLQQLRQQSRRGLLLERRAQPVSTRLQGGLRFLLPLLTALPSGHLVVSFPQP